jgi:trimeric autotransporter adhesin
MTGILRPASLILICAALGQVASPAAGLAQTTLLEVADNNAPDGKKILQVNNDGGLVSRGDINVGVIPSSGPGARLMWYPRKSAFRAGNTIAGEWDDANVGPGSIALGHSPTASGDASTALGSRTTASGETSTATGHRTTASGRGSTAMGLTTIASGGSSTALGSSTLASGDYSTAIGESAKATARVATAIGLGTQASGRNSLATGESTAASGESSTAMGFRTTAGGERSTAMGSNARAIGSGSFAYGDASSDAVVGALLNQFVVRAAGGFRFRTSPNESTGCDLQSLSGTFNCTSSRLAKEGFEDLDGGAVLEKLAAMPIQRWRYRGTDERHVGPAAEDFYAAFALGQGPTTISTVDADGISLLAVQALERRTAELREENATLRAELEALRATVHRMARRPL